MSKARPVGRPAKLAGSGRKFIRSYFGDSAHLDNKESINVSKEICFGLAIFRATFGCDDNDQESMFHGFSPHEIRLARDKSQIRTNQVEKEHRARGVLYTPYTLGRRTLLPVSSLAAANRCVTGTSLQNNNAHQPRKVIRNENKVTKREKSNFRAIKMKTSGTKSAVENANKDSDTSSRAIAKRFVLPVRSAHSSRVIKPNKRFRDIDNETGSCDTDSKISKKPKLDSDCYSNTDSQMGMKTDSSQSDNESERWSSSVSTASSSVVDGDLRPQTKGKVILRKAKLKVKQDLPVVGPFSSVSGDPNLVPQRVVCGVCGAVRFYRYLKQARKFGIYSCESCRKFISRVIIQLSNSTLPCKLGKGTCTIPLYLKDPLTGELSKNKRCKACWLKMCIHCYCMPDQLASRLTKRLPAYMRSGLPFSATTADQDHKLSKKKLAPEERHLTLKRYNLKSSVIHSRLNDKNVEKQINLAKSIRKRAEAVVRKDSRTHKQAPSTTSLNTLKVNSKSQHGIVSKKIKSNGTLEVGKKIKEKRPVKHTIEFIMKQRRNKELKANKKDEKLMRLQKLNLKGPRVKHVCRSASLVLGQPVATFTDSSPSKHNTCTSGNDCDLENSCTSSSSHSESNRQQDDLSINHKNVDQGARMRQTSNGESDVTQPKSKYNSSKKSIVNDSTDEGLLEGKARTLQDLSRQHYELVNGASLRDDISVISIAFWESYDPEEVCKTGFALIGIGDSFDTRAICFICGSAGLDKMIHCACCCEPFHHYCIEGVSQSQSQDSEDWWLVDWLCTRCTLCNTCGKGGGGQVTCQRCHKSHHSECLAVDRLASRFHSSERPWVCPSCLCCKSCHKSEVYKFVGNLPLCQNCFRLRRKGNFCPLCQGCYDENDFDTKMMECEHCKCWVHAKCEGLSNEKYEILSILPDSVEFVCRKCCNVQPAPWWCAVEAEMKAGFLAVLKSLSKNRKACDLLKWSPTKRANICACGEGVRQRFQELSEQSDAESVDAALHSDIPIKDEPTVSEEECLKKEATFSSDCNKSLVCSSSDKCAGSCELRTKYSMSMREYPVLGKSDELQLKLDNDAIIYQTSEEKASQFSPHATSQSDSGIGSTDDELKPTNDKCFCLRSEIWSKTHPTLLTIKKKVNSNEYTSLGEFNKEMEEVIQTVEGAELLNLYNHSLEDVFPWFKRKGSTVSDQTTTFNPIDSIKTAKITSIDKLDDEELEKCAELKGKLNKESNYYYNIKEIVDDRVCVLCKQVGEGEVTEEGRLLYCGYNDWVHTNCALWSNEVFEEIDGSLQNVQSAISRSRHIRCSKCSKKGASVGCCNRSCPEAYHFNCAKGSDCIFFEDKSLFCVNHKNDTKVSRPLVAGSDYVVSRPIYVELEQKKRKCVARHNVQVMIGSLTITNLGEFVPDLSDQTCSILPCNFQCTRLYWSSVEPWRLVHYQIKTKIVYTVSEALLDNDKNFTIDHSTDKKEVTEEQTVSKCDSEVKEVVDFILETVSSKDEEDTQAPADLLPPELKEAIFEDLPHDILSGISMQDIFPKLMALDFSSVETKPHKEYQSINKPKKLKLENINSTVKKQSPSKIKIQKYDNRVKATSQCSVFLKRMTTIPHEGMTRVKALEEKENTDKWSTEKILQIDGAGDCSESSDSCSPTSEVSCNSLFPTQTRSMKLKKLFQNQTCRKPRILQVDGVDDSCCISSCSSSECGSPLRDFECSWKLGQVDGAMDFCNNNDRLEENPVKCTRCHRTYRTAQSFERHLQSCSADYILSCSESDSSEEDKGSNPEVGMTDMDCSSNNHLVSYNSEKINPETQEHVHSLPNEITSLHNTLVPSKTDSSNCIQIVQSNSQTENLNNPLESNYNQNCDTNVNSSTVLVTQNSLVTLSPKNDATSKSESNKSQVSSSVVSTETLSIRTQPLRTYSRRKKLNTCTSISLPESKSCQYNPTVMDYQASAASPTLILQQIPTHSHSAVSPYIEAVPAQTAPSNIQYQFITTMDPHHQEKPQVPLTIQLQPQINIQPVMPTVLGTIIQTNGVEQLVVNSPTVAPLNQQPMYITNVNQPVYMGMETVISNTVMSSSQFVSGMMTGSSYSATTTQVFQTAKPVVDLPQSYIVVNTRSNAVPDAMSQNMYAPQGPQPWSYNYQETYKVKGRTTYQQVTRQIIQEENNLNSVKMVNSSRAPVLMDKPIVQAVTVKKTHSIHQTSTVPNLVNNVNPIVLNSVNNEYPLVNGFTLEDLSKRVTQDSNTYSNADRQKLPTKVHPNNGNVYKDINCHQVDLVKVNEKCQENYENIPNKFISHDTKKTCIGNLENLVKPVITKVKSDPSKVNCNISVYISKTKPSKSNDIPRDYQSVDTSVALPMPCELPEIPLQQVESDSNTLQSEKTSNVNTAELRRIPLKEKKTVTNKTKINNKRKNGSVNCMSNPKLVYEISSQDGLSVCSQDLAEAWKTIFEAVQSARAAKCLPPLPQNSFVSDLRILGLDNNSVKYLVEQIPGDGCCTKYKPTYHKSKLMNNNDRLCENPTGSARTEPYPNTRRKYDMFSWLASRHRRPPKLIVNSETEIVNGISRRATSLNLPMAMRFRHLKETSKEAVGVFRSDIHGRGLFCLRDIDSGEMVIEYAGEVIRAGLTDKRENYYTSKGIGCYMFRIDDQFVVDATMHGNAARFINHSCEPNCYSRVVDILGKKHILIFALRKIPQGEELTYDYKFPLEDDKITCHCLSRKCRKYLN